MKERKLKAVVIGAGWAGKGHTLALQHCGVEVVCICARKMLIVRKVADQLGIRHASTDWRKALSEYEPDIVALATPAILRREVIEVAAQKGCHLLCEKPLATTSEEAGQCLSLAEEAGVKHAYAATHRYDAGVAWIRELIDRGTIGHLRQIDIISCIPYYGAYTPWRWIDSLRLGGGILHNGLPHLAGMLERLVGGQLRSAAGMAQNHRLSAPIVPDVHDFREFLDRDLSPSEAEKLEWRECDADTGFSALLSFETSKSSAIPVLTRLDLAASEASPANGWYFQGEDGMLFAEGLFSLKAYKINAGEKTVLPVPGSMMGQLPRLGSDEENKWGALCRDFVGDIRGEDCDPYLTFADGLRYQQAVESIRGGILN